MNAMLQIGGALQRRNVQGASEAVTSVVELAKPKIESNPAPNEPDLLQAWRRVAEYRDELVRELSEYESENHPIRQDYDRIKKLSGSHGASAWKVAEGDRLAKLHAKEVCDQINGLDNAINNGTRRKGKRGLTLKQVNELVDGPPDTAAARECLVAWLSYKRAPDTENKSFYLKRRAVEELNKLARRNGGIVMDDYIDDAVQFLRAKRKSIRKYDNPPSGMFEALAQRVINYLLTK